jgi:hypothetical protein
VIVRLLTALSGRLVATPSTVTTRSDPTTSTLTLWSAPSGSVTSHATGALLSAAGAVAALSGCWDGDGAALGALVAEEAGSALGCEDCAAGVLDPAGSPALVVGSALVGVLGLLPAAALDAAGCSLAPAVAAAVSGGLES